jgi:ketosteroid isomerase-like protein
MYSRRISTVMACALVAACLLTAREPAQAASPHNSAQALVKSYFAIANAGLNTGDFSALTTVYAPNVTLVVSNPKGVTTVLQGMAKITAWYKAWAAANVGAQLTSVRTTSPVPNMVIDYEQGYKPGHPNFAGCAHIFTVQSGKIVTDDWIVYYVKK